MTLPTGLKGPWREAVLSLPLGPSWAGWTAPHAQRPAASASDPSAVLFVRRHEDDHVVGRIVVDVKEELEEDVGRNRPTGLSAGLLLRSSWWPVLWPAGLLWPLGSRWALGGLQELMKPAGPVRVKRGNSKCFPVGIHGRSWPASVDWWPTHWGRRVTRSSLTSEPRRSVAGQLRGKKEIMAADVVRVDLVDPPNSVHRAG